MPSFHESSSADWRSYREMSERLRAICVQAINNCESLPVEVISRREAISQVGITFVDQSYIDHLDQQIALEPRGQAWNDRLKTRRDGLSHYTDQELAECHLQLDSNEYLIKIDPVAMTVVFWEVYSAE